MTGPSWYRKLHPENPYWCEPCNKRVWLHERHTETVHGGEKPVKP